MHGESSHQAGTVVDPFAFILSPGFSMCLRAGSGLPRGLSSPLHRPFLSPPTASDRTSGHFSLYLTPELAHPANRPSQPGLRGSELILLIAEPAHEGA